MKTYTKEELEVILEKHSKWLNGEKGGDRANLFEADLSKANLSKANLSTANLSEANLSKAYLSTANLSEANLSTADLYGADLNKLVSTRTIVPNGQFIGYKKLKSKAIATILIPKSASRMGGLFGRKCIASKVKVLKIEGGDGTPNVDSYSSKIEYKVGKWVKSNKYDSNILNGCFNGIHFYITKEEAEEYN